MQKLLGLKAAEVSLVPQGANRRRFMIFKGASKSPMQEELNKAIANADPEMMKRVGELLDKHLTNDAEGNGGVVRTAAQAISRIATNLKGKMSPAAMHSLVDEVGFKLTEDGKGEGEEGGAGATSVGEALSHGETVSMAKSKDIPKEELEKAAMCAQKAYDEHLMKLGYQMYPEAQVQMKSKSGEPAKEKEEEKVEKTAVAQLAPEAQAKLDAIFKANEDLVKQNQELRAEISALQTVNKQRDFIQKAEQYDGLGLPREMIVKTLSDADKAGKESLDLIVKQYDMLLEREKVAKSFGGSLFREIGTSLPGSAGGGNPTQTMWERIEKAALAVVEKSGEKITKAEAVTNFLMTPEGTRMYAEHQATRKDGI